MKTAILFTFNWVETIMSISAMKKSKLAAATLLKLMYVYTRSLQKLSRWNQIMDKVRELSGAFQLDTGVQCRLPTLVQDTRTEFLLDYFSHIRRIVVYSSIYLFSRYLFCFLKNPSRDKNKNDHNTDCLMFTVLQHLYHYIHDTAMRNYWNTPVSSLLVTTL